MNRVSFKECWLLILAFLVFLIVDFRVSLGIALGFFCSNIHFKLIEKQFRAICRGETGGVFLYGSYALRLAILASPIILSCLFPDYLHWTGVVGGLLFDKFKLYYRHLRSSIKKG